MPPFNIVDGLQDVFTETSLKRVVSRLIGHPLIWEFLSQKENFEAVRRILGSVADRWTITGVIEAAAGVERHDENALEAGSSTQPEDLRKIIQEDSGIPSLSAISLCVKDFLKTRSFDEFLNGVAREFKIDEKKKRWSLIFSIIVQESENPLCYFEVFTYGKIAEKNLLLSYALKTDLDMRERFTLIVKELADPQNAGWLDELNDQLGREGLGAYSKQLAANFLDLAMGYKALAAPACLNISELLTRIEISHHLIHLSKTAERQDLMDVFEEQTSALLAELIKRTGASLPSHTEIQKIETKSDNEINQEKSRASLLSEKISLARSVFPADPMTAAALAREVVAELRDMVPEKSVFSAFSLEECLDLVDFLVAAGLIREAREFLDQVLAEAPGNIDFLRISANLNHQHGGHQRAVEDFSLLMALINLSRVEKIKFSDSLAYLNEWQRAYDISRQTNFVDRADVERLLMCAIYAGQFQAAEEIIRDNPFNISEWPLTQIISEPKIQQLGEDFDFYYRRIWTSLKNEDEKVFLVELLNRNRQSVLANGLVQEDIEGSAEFSSVAIKGVNLYIEQNEIEKAKAVLKSAAPGESVSQKAFERFIYLLLRYGFQEKAIRMLSDFSGRWQLSPSLSLSSAQAHLFAGDFRLAQELFEQINRYESLDEENFTLYVLALLRVHPSAFPIGVNTKVFEEIKNRAQRIRSFNSEGDVILRILQIELEETGRIGKYQAAMDNETRALNHETWRYWAALGSEHFNDGQYDKAILAFKEVERFKPFSEDLLMALLESHLRLSLLDEAEVILHRLLSIDGITLADILVLPSKIAFSQEWLPFIEFERKKFPDCKEIGFLFGLALLKKARFDQARDVALDLYTRSKLNLDEQLLAAQILISSGEENYGLRILNVLFSGNQDIAPEHYLVAARIYEQLGQVSQALVMINHILPLDQPLTAYKLDLLLKLDKVDDALEILEGPASAASLSKIEVNQLVLVQNEDWLLMTESESYFGQIASMVYLRAGKIDLAVDVIRKNWEINPEDERVALHYLEMAKLGNNPIGLGRILDFYASRDIANHTLACSLGEAALILNQEVLAAKLLSRCMEKVSGNTHAKILQAILLKRNGNTSDARDIFKEIMDQWGEKSELPNGQTSMLKGYYPFARLNFEMGDFRKAMDICHDEISRLGWLPAFINLFMDALLSSLKKNLLLKKIFVNRHCIPIENRDIDLVREIRSLEGNSIGASVDQSQLDLCMVYLDPKSINEQGLEALLESSLTSYDRIFISFLRNGAERTDLQIAHTLGALDDIILLALLIVDERPERSLELITEKINLRSDNPVHLAALAVIYNKLGNYSDAYSAITLALAEWAEEYAWESLAGEISQKRGDLANAISHFKRADDLAEKMENRGQIEALHLLTETKESIPLLEAKLADDAENSGLLLKLAHLCEKFLKYGKAVQHYEQAIKVDPDLTEPYERLSKLSVRLGNLTRAMEYIEAGLSIDASASVLIIQKSKILKSLEGSGRAREFLEGEVSTRKEGKAALQAALADLIFESDGLTDCLSFLDGLPDDENDSPALAHAKGKYLLLAGEFGGARTLLEKTLQAFPHDFVTLALMGDIYRQQGDLDQAMDFYLQAIKLNPTDEDLYLNLFDLYNERRDYESAGKSLEKGIVANPGSLMLHIQLSKFYFQHGLLESAKEKIRLALLLDPSDEEALSLERLMMVQPLEFARENKVIIE